jgi:hypothetical protein
MDGTLEGQLNEDLSRTGSSTGSCSFFKWPLELSENQKTAMVNYFQVPTGSSAIGLKVFPEQRIKFAKGFEKLLLDKAMDATVNTHQDQQKIVTISGIITEPRRG